MFTASGRIPRYACALTRKPAALLLAEQSAYFLEGA